MQKPSTLILDKETLYVEAGSTREGAFHDAILNWLDEHYSSPKGNIGLLRQWLNEDRITDPAKMVTNEDIERFLGIGKDKEATK